MECFGADSNWIQWQKISFCTKNPVSKFVHAKIKWIQIISCEWTTNRYRDWIAHLKTFKKPAKSKIIDTLARWLHLLKYRNYILIYWFVCIFFRNIISHETSGSLKIKRANLICLAISVKVEIWFAIKRKSCCSVCHIQNGIKFVWKEKPMQAKKLEFFNNKST